MPLEKNPQRSTLIPIIRSDIQIIEGPRDPTGEPTYQLYDPVRRKYFQIGWQEKQILSRCEPGMTYSALATSIQKNTTINITEENLRTFFIIASRMHLLDEKQSSDEMLKEYQLSKKKWLTFFLTRYLFFKIPIFTPEQFLRNTLHNVRFLASRAAFYIYALAGIVGLYFLLTQFDEFVHTITYFFNMKGLLAYAVTIALVKVVHELAHAYVATAYGVRVPTMGVALLVLWPVLYTDVTDSWKLKDRRQRIYISSAGIISEMVLAAFALCLWGFTDPGVLNSACFLVASSSLINTIFVNANPAMRYDGYYILMDLWKIDNLQQKAFNLTRWKFREWLFGFGFPCPETGTLREQRALIFFAIYTSIYRIVVYTTVAFFVYYKFTKALGVLLFLAEIYIFILKPLYDEIVAVIKLRSKIKWGPRTIFFISLFALLILFFVLPLPHSIHFSGITLPESQQLLYIPVDSTIEKILVKKGQRVNKGDLLTVLTSKEAFATLKSLESEALAVEQELNAALLNEKHSPYVKEKQGELATSKQQLETQQSIQDQLHMFAALSGLVYDFDENLRIGMPIARDTVIGKIADLETMIILLFVPEDEVSYIKVGDKVSFLTSELTHVDGTVYNLLPVREAKLSYPQLSSIAKGDLPVVKDPKTNQFNLIGSYYLAYVKPDSPESIPWIGKLGSGSVYLGNRSYLVFFMEKIYRTLWKESNL